MIAERSIRILLVEDNLGDVRLLEQMLRQVPDLRFAISHVERLEEAPHLLDREKFDVILLDLSLPDSEGIETVRRAVSEARSIPIVVFTGLSDQSMGAQAVHEGAQDYLVKDEIDGWAIVRTIRYSLERTQVAAEREQIGRELADARREIVFLHSLVPVCSKCGRKRTDEPYYWKRVEQYVRHHVPAEERSAWCAACAAAGDGSLDQEYGYG